MELESISKPDKKNKPTSKKFDDYVIFASCNTIAFFSIYGQFGAMRKPDSRWIVCKTYIFINSNLLSYKNCKQN